MADETMDVGSRVRIREGTFKNYEGVVILVDHENDRVTMETNIFGRLTPVECAPRQLELV